MILMNVWIISIQNAMPCHSIQSHNDNSNGLQYFCSTSPSVLWSKQPGILIFQNSESACGMTYVYRQCKQKTLLVYLCFCLDEKDDFEEEGGTAAMNEHLRNC